MKEQLEVLHKYLIELKNLSDQDFNDDSIALKFKEILCRVVSTLELLVKTFPDGLTKDILNTIKDICSILCRTLPELKE